VAVRHAGEGLAGCFHRGEQAVDQRADLRDLLINMADVRDAEDPARRTARPNGGAQRVLADHPDGRRTEFENRLAVVPGESRELRASDPPTHSSALRTQDGTDPGSVRSSSVSLPGSTQLLQCGIVRDPHLGWQAICLFRPP
jgi:hypothetical protein